MAVAPLSHSLKKAQKLFLQIQLRDFILEFSSNLVSANENLVFRLFVLKDERVGEARVEVRVQVGQVAPDQALDAIGSLLESGDTSSALRIIDLTSDLLNDPDEVCTIRFSLE